MAAGTNNFARNLNDFYLSQNEQDLLLNALSSNNPTAHLGANSYRALERKDAKTQQSPTGHVQPPKPDLRRASNNAQMYKSPQNRDFSSSQLAGIYDESPLLDYDYDFTADGINDFNVGNGDDMIGGLPYVPNSSVRDGEKDLPVKRKSIDDESSPGDGGGKRIQSDEKVAKKPGRKLLTSEPTSKRKAQNRAAQRAFRERKEKHLKDLETKVEELQKRSESYSHENGLLKAQIERLQLELREYRKRLSFSGTGIPRFSSSGFSNLNTANGNNFQFDFPKFNGISDIHSASSGLLTKKAANASSSASSRKSISSTSTPIADGPSPSQQSELMHPHRATISGDASESVNQKSTDYLPQNRLQNTTARRTGTMDSTSPSPFAQPGLSSSNSTTVDSPSASSVSQQGAGSSLCTSPESASLSNNVGKSVCENGLGTIDEGEISFCEKLNMACGNAQNPIPRAMSMSNDSSAVLSGTVKTPLADVNGIDWLAQQNGNQFDPVLFGNYRETQDNLAQDYGGFFTDAFMLPDLGSPFNNYGDFASPSQQPKRDLMQEVEDAQNGDDAEEVVPGEDVSQMLPCNKIWDCLQHNEKFQAGEVDVDDLCAELRTKAKCSESGVVVNKKVVDEIIERAARKT